MSTLGQNWARTFDRGLDYAESLGGVQWFRAPLPRRWHRCAPQTRGQIGARYTERCACGAIRHRDRGRWDEKNQRRRDRERRGAGTGRDGRP